MLSFSYTKDDGKTTQRNIIPISSPTDKYFGIDLSELSEEDQGIFEARYQEIMDTKDSAIHQLMFDMDVRFKFRNFIPAKMTNIVSD